MKIKDILYKTPEITEEKLLEIIDKRKRFLNLKTWSRNKYSDAKDILNEWDLIQIKKSNLTKSQRDQLCMLVSACLIEMVQNNENTENNN